MPVTCSGSFLCRVRECVCEVESRGLEFGTGHFQTARENTEHQLTLLLLGVGGAGLVVHIVLRVDCPGTHCETELNIRFYLARVGSAVEQSEFNRSFGKECVEIDTVVSCGIIVPVVDASAVVVVYRAVPNRFKFALGHLLIGLHCVEELTRHLLAPMISAILDLQCFIEQILSSDCEVHQTSEALGLSLIHILSRYKELADERAKSIEETELESEQIISLTNKLSELSAKTGTTASEKQEMLAIIKALNSEIPALNLSDVYKRQPKHSFMEGILGRPL